MGFWKDRRVICTGGSGFLGSHLVDALRERGCNPFVPRSNDYNLQIVTKTSHMLQDAEYYCGSQTIEFLFHLAATCGGIGLNRAQPATMWWDNVMMGANLLEAAKRHGVGKFVGVGTVCSYPKFTPVPFSEKSFWDGYPEETNAPYGIAKKLLLVGLQAYGEQHGLPWVYVVPTNLYGERDHFDPASSHVIPALVRKFLEAREAGADTVEVWGTGRPTRDFLYAGDAAEALLLAAEGAEGGPYNVGSGREVSIAELVDLVAKATGYKGGIEFDASKPDGQPRRCLDSSTFTKLTGWRPEVSLEAGLARTVAWYVNEHREVDGVDDWDMTSCIAKAKGVPAPPSEGPSV